MFNVPRVVYQSTLSHRMLIVLLPGQLGLFSPTVLKGKGTGGGLEALERGSHTKLADLLPLHELSNLHAKRIFFLNGGGGSVVALHHSSGREFTISSFVPVLAHRIRQAVSG